MLFSHKKVYMYLLYRLALVNSVTGVVGGVTGVVGGVTGVVGGGEEETSELLYNVNMEEYGYYSHISLDFETTLNTQKSGVVLYVTILGKLFYYD